MEHDLHAAYGSINYPERRFLAAITSLLGRINHLIHVDGTEDGRSTLTYRCG